MYINDCIYIKDIPQDCIDDCSQGGRDAISYVQKWIKRLDFSVDVEKAINCLSEYGAWSVEELQADTAEELAEKVLWIACGDFSEYQYDSERYGSDIFSLIG